MKNLLIVVLVLFMITMVGCGKTQEVAPTPTVGVVETPSAEPTPKIAKEGENPVSEAPLQVLLFNASEEIEIPTQLTVVDFTALVAELRSGKEAAAEPIITEKETMRAMLSVYSIVETAVLDEDGKETGEVKNFVDTKFVNNLLEDTQSVNAQLETDDFLVLYQYSETDEKGQETVKYASYGGIYNGMDFEQDTLGFYPIAITADSVTVLSDKTIAFEA